MASPIPPAGRPQLGAELGRGAEGVVYENLDQDEMAVTDPVDGMRATASELLFFARQQGVNLEPLCSELAFQKDHRSIFFWRKQAEIPSTGRPDEPEGTLHYNLQGAVRKLPGVLRESASAFRVGWTEAGTLKDIEEAFQLVKAWLLERKEVDELPQRSVHRYGILPSAL